MYRLEAGHLAHCSNSRSQVLYLGGDVCGECHINALDVTCAMIKCSLDLTAGKRCSMLDTWRSITRDSIELQGKMDE